MSASPTAAVDRLLAAAHGARSAMDYCRFQALDIDADGIADPLEVLDDARDNLAHALATFTRECGSHVPRYRGPAGWICTLCYLNRKAL